MGTRTMYMHTIHDQPAYYSPRAGQIVYAGRGRVVLCHSLRQIRQEQAATMEWRAAQGFSDEPGKYGYVLVATPTPEATNG